MEKLSDAYMFVRVGRQRGSATAFSPIGGNGSEHVVNVAFNRVVYVVQAETYRITMYDNANSSFSGSYNNIIKRMRIVTAKFYCEATL
jgi:hypothetical protein